MSSDNPLLNDDFPPCFADVKAEHVAPAVKELLVQAKAAMTALEQNEAAPTFDNSMLTLDKMTEQLDRSMGVAGHLEGVATTDALREAYSAARETVSAFTSQIALSPALYQRVRSFAESAEGKALTGHRKRSVEKTLRYFVRHGAGLKPDDKARLTEIDLALTKVTIKYSQNLLDATNAFELLVDDKEALAGLPDSALQAARQNAQSKGHEGYRFTLQAPSYIPLLTHADNEKLREQVYRAAVSRASSGDFDNRAIAEQILQLRQEKSALLGYANFADFVTEERMAKSGTRARQFVDDLRERTLAHFAAETKQLGAFRKELNPAAEGELKPWDVAYCAEKERQSRYNFEGELLRPYFGFKKVVEGLFVIARRLYQIDFKPWPEAQVWDPAVTAYKILDEKGAWVAGFYVDAYPRENKQAGAWMDGLVSCATGDTVRKPLAALVANITPPVGDADAFVSHREVQTLFHEFGHLMHHCLSRTELVSQAGTQVAWDFVELPSQIFENWSWEREALDLFAHHRHTGATIPDDLLNAMQRARTYRAATQQMRQLGFATMDLALHTVYQKNKDGDATAYGRKVLEQFSPTPLPDEHAMVASFGHLFGGPVAYASGYYSYKWAEVLDADAFGRFAKNGLFDSETGSAFRREILQRGDEEDPAVLYRNFDGARPRSQPTAHAPWYREQGLALPRPKEPPFKEACR